MDPSPSSSSMEVAPDNSDNEDAEDGAFLDDTTYQVLEMLNFKIVPKEPGDAGYYSVPFVPSEARIYAAEYCRLENIIKDLKRRNEELESSMSSRDGGPQREREGRSERDAELETIREKVKQVEALSAKNSELEDKLSNERKLTAELRNELEQVNNLLSEKRNEVKVIQDEFKGVENKCLQLRKEIVLQKDVIATKDGEVEECKIIIHEREQEIEEHSRVITNLRKEMEKCQLRITEVEATAQEVEAQKLKLEVDLATTQNKMASLEVQVENYIQENSELQTNFDQSKLTIEALDAQLVEVERTLEADQLELQETRKTNDSLEERVKELEIGNSNKQETINLLQKSVEEKDRVKLDLEAKCRKLRNILSTVNSEVEQITEYLKMIAPSTMPNSSSMETTSTAGPLGLDGGISIQIESKFRDWAENQRLLKNELAKTKSVLEGLLQLTLANRRRQQKETPSTSTPPSTNESLETTPNPAVPVWSYATPIPQFSYRDALISKSQASSLMPVPTPDSSMSAIPSTSRLTTPTPTATLSGSNRKPREKPSSSSTPRSESEVRQLLVDEANVTETAAQTTGGGVSRESSQIHGVDTSKSHLGAFCLCKRKYTSESNLQMHINYYTKEWKFKCHICQKPFCFLVYLNRHLKSFHKMKIPLKRGWLGCRECGKQFPSKVKLSQHQLSVHTLQSSKKVVQGQAISTGAPESGNQAATSDTSTSIRISLKNTKTRKRPHWTVVRPTSGGENSSMWETDDEAEDIEKRSTSEAMPHPSENDSSTSDNRLNQTGNSSIAHGEDTSKTHLGNFCLCGYQSKEKWGLQSHIQYYTAECKFPCKLCERRFVGANYLRKHYRMHHKGYVVPNSNGCRNCGRHFSSMKALRRHYNTVHNKGRKINRSAPNLDTMEVKSSNESNSETPSSSSRDESQNGGDHLFSELISSIESSIARPSLQNTENPGPPLTITSNDEGGDATVLKKRKLPNEKQKHGIDSSKASQGHFCLCGRKSSNKTALEKHINDQNQLCRFQCEVCQMDFKGTNYLRVHMRKSHKREYPNRGCRICGSIFTTLSELRRHQKSDGCTRQSTSSDNRPSQIKHCQDLSKVQIGIFCVCGAKFKKKENLTTHIRSVSALFSQERKFQCNICEVRFMYHNKLQRHLERTHKITNIRSKGYFGCRVCGRLFPTLVKLRQHRKLTHASFTRKIHKPQVTGTPSQELASVSTVKQEKSTSGKGNIHVIDTSKARKHGNFCKCGRDFSNMHALRKHLSYHKATKQFACPECPLRFKTTSFLRKHVAVVHQGSYDLKGCTICGNVFETMDKLRWHQIQIHQIRKKIPEVDLTSTESQSQGLNHESSLQPSASSSTASGSDSKSSRNPSIKIPLAQKQSWSVTKRKHEVDMSKRHLGHYCVCGTRCTSVVNLKRHIEYFTRDRKFQCHLCSQQFLFKSYLNSHLKGSHKILHSDQFGLKGCTHCGRTFSSHQELIRHCSSEHSLQFSSPSKTSRTETPTTPKSTLPPVRHASPSNSQQRPAKNTKKRIFPSPQNKQKNTHGIDLSKPLSDHFCICGRQFEKMKDLRNHVLEQVSREKEQPSTSQNSQYSILQARLTSGVDGITQQGSNRIPSPSKANTATLQRNNEQLSHLTLHKPVRFTGSPELWICFCGEQFENSELLQKHIAEKSESTDQQACPSIIVNTNEDLENGDNASAVCAVPEPAVVETPEKLKHGVDASKEHLGFFCICKRKFLQREYLKAHIQYHTREKKFSCDICKQKFVNLKYLNLHKRKSHQYIAKIGQAGCMDCGRIFDSKQELGEHRVKIFSPAGQLLKIVCSSADKELTNGQSTSSTSKTSEEPRGPLSVKALVAQVSSASRSDNGENWISVTPSISVRLGASNKNAAVVTPGTSSGTSDSVSMEVVPSDEPLTNPPHPAHGVDNSKIGYFCYCGQGCSYKHTLLRHIKRFTAERKFVCRNCGEGFSGANLLRNHMLRVHKIMQNVSVGCKECGDFFPTNMELYHHFRMVHNHGSQIEPWETKYVPPTPSHSQQELSQELPIDLEPEVPAAQGSVNGQQVDREIHQRVPPDPLSEDMENNYLCTCGKRFACPSSLRNHIRTKTNGKIFKCSWCPMSFDLHGNLKKHVKGVHKVDSQNGKFACGVCAKTFPSYKNVNNHRRLVHQTKPKNTANEDSNAGTDNFSEL